MARISKADLVKLQKKLVTDAAIGAEFGITRQAVHQLRKKYGIDSSLSNNPERNSEIVSMYEAGTPGTDIAKKYKLSISQTYRIINETKKPAKKAAKKAAPKAAPKAAAPKAAEPKVAVKKAPAKKAKKAKAKKS
jgi:hypothetical protein